MTRQGALSLLKRFGPTCFGLLLLVGALYVVQREFRGLSWQDIQTALHATPPSALWLAAVCTIGAYLLLSAYDRLGSIYAGHPVSWRRSLLASFCAYSLANNIGFATVSGAAVRYRFYASWGLAPVAIAKVIAITSLTFGLGGFAIAGLVLVLEPDLLTFLGPGAPRWILPLLGFFCWAIVITYVVLARFVPHIRLFGHQIDLPGFRIALAQVALATADVAVTAMIFYALLPPAEGLGFLHFLGIYIAAYMAGLAANVPGGIGVFDGAILFALAGFLPTPVVVGALLLFRLFYYIIPLFLAGALFAGFEVSQRRKLVGRLAPDRGIAVSFEVPALAGLTGLAALVLIFIGALPPKPSLLGPVPDFLEDAASHFAASVVGSLLLAAAYGLVRRLVLAWWGSLFLLLNGALILVLRGEPLWLIAAFLLVPLLLTTARGAFYRNARLIGEAVSADGVGALAGALAGHGAQRGERGVLDAEGQGVVGRERRGCGVDHLAREHHHQHVVGTAGGGAEAEVADHAAVAVDAEAVDGLVADAVGEFLVAHRRQAGDVGLEELGGQGGGDALATEAEAADRVMDARGQDLRIELVPVALEGRARDLRRGGAAVLGGAGCKLQETHAGAPEVRRDGRRRAVPHEPAAP